MKKRKSALSRLEYNNEQDNLVVAESIPESNSTEIEPEMHSAPSSEPSPAKKKGSPLSKIADRTQDEPSTEESENPTSVITKEDIVADNKDSITAPVVPIKEKKRKKNPFKKTPVFTTVTVSDSPLDKISEATETVEEDTPSNSEVQNEDVIDVSYMLQQDKMEKAEKRSAILKKVLAVLLIFGCVYMLFLIYGVFNTNYIYNENGEIVPQKMTVKQIREMEHFDEIATQYRIGRILYEKVLTLDYRVAAGIEDAKLVAPEYESILEDVESLSIQIQALEVPAKYSQVKNMLATWIQTDVAVYCQRMSQAISQDNAEYAQQAMQYRTIMYNDFSLITENIVVIGQTIDGVDITDIIEWSPDKFVRDNLGAIQ